MIRKPLPKHWRTLGALAILFFTVAVSSIWYLYTAIETLKGNEAAAQAVDVVLKRVYLCGESEEEIKKETVASSDELLMRYQDWTFVSRQRNVYTFEKKLNDLSPYCKEHAYFGLSENGELTLFDGVPENGKVIQTFFQLNTEKLESSLPVDEMKILRKGIRITDAAEYNSIISTYSEFSGDEKETAVQLK
ncbi:BofC C-terminal domain-containing protein [Aneurinibacillus sp. REN35]|uniref:BofC C-terminal domain-containing protein n=1 Tax=Aneurinibacillus sp. REN35 TaxID=3237286 RepID=UPI0035274274